jgi:hypothetical protein
MQLRLERVHSDEDDTLGLLYIDGNLFGFVVEDPYHKEKIPGKTRIPAGTYKIALTYSPKFKKNMWELLNVPKFTGIRIHPGTIPEDTEGCIMVGYSAYLNPDGESRIGDSLVACNKLYTLLENAKDNGETISICIVDNDQFQIVNLD